MPGNGALAVDATVGTTVGVIDGVTVEVAVALANELTLGAWH